MATRESSGVPLLEALDGFEAGAGELGGGSAVPEVVATEEVFVAPALAGVPGGQDPSE